MQPLGAAGGSPNSKEHNMVVPQLGIVRVEAVPPRACGESRSGPQSGS